MGCGAVSAKPSEEESAAAEAAEPCTTARVLTDADQAAAHDRLRKLAELDAATKVPFILIELTGEGHEQGEIEVCGKDEYGVCDALDEYFTNEKNEWRCTKLDVEKDVVPFCKRKYLWPGYKLIGDEGMNNMGRSVMRLVDFMSSSGSWTLATVTSGNVGKTGNVREMQIIFKAPHPMNLVAPHFLIELRSAGYIEICADFDNAREEDRNVLETLDTYFTERFKAEVLAGHEDFCDLCYKVGDGIFRGSSGSSDSNFGVLVTMVCDRVVSIPGWSLVATSCGSEGESGEYVQQELVFRRDHHPLGDSCYTMVVLNASGNIEVNAKQERGRGVLSKLHKFLVSKWLCKGTDQFEEGDTSCRRYSWDAKDFMTANAEIIDFFEHQGFEIQVCTQYSIKEGDNETREQQLLFRPGKTEVGTVEPHMLIELYTGEGLEDIHADPEEPTQVLANQYIHLNSVESSAIATQALEALDDFIVNQLGGTKESDDRYQLNMFLCRGWYENNLSQWTMRVCDFMVDRLGWSFVVCSLCNTGEYGQLRTQQLIFHWDGDKRDVPVATMTFNNVDRSEWTEHDLPSHWTIPEVCCFDRMYDMTSCTEREIKALQEMLDSTFKRVLTRDRAPDDDAPEDEEMPYRLEVVHAFRSEHSLLYQRFSKQLTIQQDAVEIEVPFGVKTSTARTLVTSRLQNGTGYLFHGTNPSSAMSILKTGFALRHAGSATGTMYGNGVYLAECSSKSDEYGRDDGGNTYPGLLAMIVCRCALGTPLVVHEAGDHVSAAKDQGYHCVCGDRESVHPKTYREFVFFDEAQIYPEYTIIYRRQWEREKVPEHMRTKTTGTTGRFWQFRGDMFGFRGWKNVPTEINKILVHAATIGSTAPIRVEFRSKEVYWDVHQRRVSDADGNQSPLRPPMQGVVATSSSDT